MNNAIAQALTRLSTQIRATESQYARAPESTLLLAVSKTKPVSAILDAYAAGQRDFAENYVDEAIQKQNEIAKLADPVDITWHFIGAVQSNKTALLARHFDWVHAIDRDKIARRLSAQRPIHLPPLNCCVQVNIDAEQSKAGVSPTELPELCKLCTSLPNIVLRGLMVIPAPRAEFAQQREVFAATRELFTQQQSRTPGLDTLSMGMSGDWEAAIAEGATIIRIGTAIFGARG